MPLSLEREFFGVITTMFSRLFSGGRFVRGRGDFVRFKLLEGDAVQIYTHERVPAAPGNVDKTLKYDV